MASITLAKSMLDDITRWLQKGFNVQRRWAGGGAWVCRGAAGLAAERLQRAAQVGGRGAVRVGGVEVL